MMLRFYADTIRQAKPQVSRRVTRTGSGKLAGPGRWRGTIQLQRLSLPGNRRAAPGRTGDHFAQILRAQEEAGPTPILVLTHGYRPLEDFRKRLLIGQAAGRYGFWVNRYGHLSDHKLETIRETV